MRSSLEATKSLRAAVPTTHGSNVVLVMTMVMMMMIIVGGVRGYLREVVKRH